MSPNKRKMLSDWEAPYLQSLIHLIETQSKKTLIHWVLDYSEECLLPLWKKHFEEDLRPAEAIQAARSWVAGDIKLPEAKKYILRCHEAAREAEGNPIAQAVARAIGQSASTIHSPRHCIGLALYGALGEAYDRWGTEAPWERILEEAADACGRMEAALRTIALTDEKNPAKISWKC